MNRNQDIEEGLEEYNELDIRHEDEHLYVENPGYLGFLGGLGSFEPTEVHMVRLGGVKVAGRDKHPFSYWSGEAVVSGKFEGSPDTLRIRWDQNGAVLEIEHAVTV